MNKFMLSVRLFFSAVFIGAVALGHTWALVVSLIMISVAVEIIEWRLREHRHWVRVNYVKGNYETMTEKPMRASR